MRIWARRGAPPRKGKTARGEEDAKGRGGGCVGAALWIADGRRKAAEDC
eukprot:gene14824-7757_t